MWNVGFQLRDLLVLRKSTKEKIKMRLCFMIISCKAHLLKKCITGTFNTAGDANDISNDSLENAPVVLQQRKRWLIRCQSGLMPALKKAFVALISSLNTDSTLSCNILQNQNCDFRALPWLLLLLYSSISLAGTLFEYPRPVYYIPTPLVLHSNHCHYCPLYNSWKTLACFT